MLDKFINDCYCKAPSGIIPVVDFIGHYRSWCRTQGLRPPMRGEIVEALQAAGLQTGLRHGQLHVVGLEHNSPRYKIVDGQIINAARVPAHS